MSKLTAFDRFTLALAPQWTAKRIRARQVAHLLSSRNYEAAAVTRRTSGWNRNNGDVNAVTARALVELRLHARDLVRNNAWAARGLETITSNTVGWGIVPRPLGSQATEAADIWKRWADSTECDPDGRMTFYGMQELALRTIVESGEVLIRRRFLKPKDAKTIPLQIEVIEPDYIDTQKNEGTIKQGVEFDSKGKRVGYWLFDAHPGSGDSSGQSKRYSAEDFIHVFRALRPGQVRGVSWFAQDIAALKDFDEFEDAQLMRQKVAACFGATVTDPDGLSTSIGEADAEDDTLETLEPGQINYLPPGKQITFASPPGVTDDGFSARTLRKIAAGLGVTYEDLTGDYSQVNFSSARMSRIAHYANVSKWQWNMLIPLMCDGVWAWAMESAVLISLLKVADRAEWSTPPMPMIEPDKEGLAYSRLVRNGAMTFSEMIRERGGDPIAHLEEYKRDMDLLDKHEIKLDSDVRAVSAAGLTQERVGLAGGKPPPEEEAATKKKAAREAELQEAFDKLLTETLRGVSHE